MPPADALYHRAAPASNAVTSPRPAMQPRARQVRPATGSDMLRSSVFRTIDFCTGHAGWVIALAFALAAASSVYAARNFAIKTDVNDLFAPDLPWTQRAFEYM